MESVLVLDKTALKTRQALQELLVAMTEGIWFSFLFLSFLKSLLSAGPFLQLLKYICFNIEEIV